MSAPKRYTITAALPYTNGPIHIGHLAGVYVPADIYARYLRLIGKDVAYISGSDEHGAAIPMRAKKEGVCKIWYANGQLEMIGHHKNGYQDSLWTFFYPSGNRKEAGSFKKDTRYGTWKSWYEDGQLKSERIIENDEIYLHHYFSEEGKPLVVDGNGNYVSYHNNGTVKWIGDYNAGRKFGEWKTFDAQKNIVSQGAYQNGVMTGNWIYYWENSSQIKLSGNVKTGKKEGVWIEYYNNEVLKYEIEYQYTPYC